jgi:2-aminoadipate transaminase
MTETEPRRGAARALRYAARAAHVEPAGPGHGGPGMIQFGSGDAYPESLPDMAEYAQMAARRYRTETLQYAPRAGLPDLREWIAGYLAGEGLRVAAESILVCNGAKQGIELTCKLFLDPGDAIVVTRPTYQSALGVFRGWEPEFLEVGMDADGMLVDELAATLAARARRGRPAPMLVAEDDPYRKIRFVGEAVPPIQALDRDDCVVGLGTFAKLVAPGLRLGWVIAAPDIIGRMAAMKADGGTCPFTQRMLLEYCRAGRLEPDIDHRVRTYRAHRDVMAQAVREHLPQASFTVPDGGYYLWLRLPEGVDSDRLAALAEAQGVQVLPASHFHATPGPRDHVRLAYSYASPSEIVDGVRRLASAFARMETPG